MYVTRPLSLYRKSPESLLEPPQDGPNSGYLVIFDEESKNKTCLGICTNKRISSHPFPQNKDLRVMRSVGVNSTLVDEIIFIPVLNQPLSSNLYYVIQNQGNHKGEACRNSKSENKSCCSRCGNFIEDVQPKPLDPSNIYQQFKIIDNDGEGFTAKSIATDGYPPAFLRQKYWNVQMHPCSKHYQLHEALGINSSLRERMPDFNFPFQNQSSQTIVVGKWYTPFMFVKEDGLNLKEQMKKSLYYEITLEQRWDKIFTSESCKGEEKEVTINVSLTVEEVLVGGNLKALKEEVDIDNRVMWLEGSSNKKGEKPLRVGLSLLVLERMKWEQQRVGCKGEGKKQVKVKINDKIGETGKSWTKFALFVLMERFVFKRLNGSIVLTYEFKHTHRIRGRGT